jgi:hypothetical protein
VLYRPSDGLRFLLVMGLVDMNFGRSGFGVEKFGSTPRGFGGFEAVWVPRFAETPNVSGRCADLSCIQDGIHTPAITRIG